MLAASYSPLASTIATTVLNFRVRNGIGCDHCVKPPTQNFRFYYFFRFHYRACFQACPVVSSAVLLESIHQNRTFNLSKFLMDPIKSLLRKERKRYLTGQDKLYFYRG